MGKQSWCMLHAEQLAWSALMFRTEAWSRVLVTGMEWIMMSGAFPLLKVGLACVPRQAGKSSDSSRAVIGSTR
jgi:hypothetical protein